MSTKAEKIADEVINEWVTTSPKWQEVCSYLLTRLIELELEVSALKDKISGYNLSNFPYNIKMTDEESERLSHCQPGQTFHFRGTDYHFAGKAKEKAVWIKTASEPSE